jgi:hypothetical protein
MDVFTTEGAGAFMPRKGMLKQSAFRRGPFLDEEQVPAASAAL